MSSAFFRWGNLRKTLPQRSSIPTWHYKPGPELLAGHLRAGGIWNTNHRDWRPELPLGALCVPLPPDLRFSYVRLATRVDSWVTIRKGDCMAYSSRRVANTLSDFSF